MASKRNRSAGTAQPSCSRNLVCNAGPSKPATTSTRTERINRKRTSEETGGPSKRRKTTSSASKDPDNQAASSSSTRKPSINSRVCNAGPSKPASTSTRTERINRKRNSEEIGGPSKRRKTTSSASKDPDNQAARTAISNFQKSSINSREDFEARYQEERFLGSGTFGSVFAGYRKEDNLPVAIKHIKRFLSIKVNVAGEITAMPSELAMLLKLSEKEPSGVVKMHDWYHLNDELIIILERPDPCMDLNKYINSRKLFLRVKEVKIITKQLVDAIIEVHSIGVFHRDIKPANILIETGSDVPRVRLIDFGCGTFLSEKRYTVKKGTPLYQSPEWFKRGWYTAEGTNVWQLGVVLFRMLHNGCYPFRNVLEIRDTEPNISTSLSEDCQDFLRSCLTKILENRPTMETLKKHPWLK